jgi:ABC-type branched-subunit amino acid transport system substrate-binding protein
MPDTLSRRHLLGAGVVGAAGTSRLATAGAALLGTALSACSKGTPRTTATTAPRVPVTTTLAPPTVRIGYVAEVTGPFAFRGELVTAALDAFQAFVDDKSGGLYHGAKVQVLPVDAPTGADGGQAYADLVQRKADAILWCSPFGLIETLPAIASGSTPVISVFADLYSYGPPGLLTGPSAKGGMVFQTLLPDRFAVDLLCAYAAEDRGFASAGLLFDTAAYPGVDHLFEASLKAHGLTNQGVYAFNSAAPGSDYSGPLLALKRSGCHLVACYSLADQASVVATLLQTFDAAYVDTLTTLRSHFKPMLVGAPWGAADPSFAQLAGDAARRGTISATSLGAVPTLPDLPIRRWLHDYVPRYNGGLLRGAEAAPADAAALVVDAAVRAGSTHGPAVVAALESGMVTKAASLAGLSFAPEQHLCLTGDDAVLLTLEYPPTPYNLGAEWREVLPRGYRGATQLVDFTLAANTRAHPDVIASVLQRRYGTSSTDGYQSGDRARVKACHAVH